MKQIAQADEAACDAWLSTLAQQTAAAAAARHSACHTAALTSAPAGCPPDTAPRPAALSCRAQPGCRQSWAQPACPGPSRGSAGQRPLPGWHEARPRLQRAGPGEYTWAGSHTQRALRWALGTLKTPPLQAALGRSCGPRQQHATRAVATMLMRALGSTHHSLTEHRLLRQDDGIQRPSHSAGGHGLPIGRSQPKAQHAQHAADVANDQHWLQWGSSPWADENMTGRATTC